MNVEVCLRESSGNPRVPELRQRVLQLLDQKLGVVDRVATGQRVIFHLRYNARTRERSGRG